MKQATHELNLHGLLTVLRKNRLFLGLIAQLEDGTTPPDQQILRSARAYVIAAIADAASRPLIILSGRVDRAYNLAEQLPVWVPQARIRRFAEPSAMFYEHAPWTANTIQSRLETLGSLMKPIGDREPNSAPPPIVVSSAHALMQKTLPVRDYQKGSRILREGMIIDPESLVRFMLEIGYFPTSIVVEPGTFCRRGGIIDVYPITSDTPIRIEFFGDEIESLRNFDPASQRSSSQVTSTALTPAREALPKFGPSAGKQLEQWFRSLPRPDEDGTSILPDSQQLSDAIAFEHLEFYLPYLYSYPAQLLDYIPQDALIIVDDWGSLYDSVAEQEEKALALRHEKVASKQIPPDYPLPYHTWDEIQDEISARQVLHLGRSTDGTGAAGDDILGSLFSPGPRHGGQLRAVLEEIFRFSKNVDQIVVVSQQAQRLAELWSEHDAYAPPITRMSEAPSAGYPVLVKGSLAEGWVFGHGDSRFHLYTDAEIFGWKRPEPRRRQQRRALSPESYFADLEVGDHVVHVEYGIGRFAGLRKRVIDATEREYLVVEYAGTDLLYVPIHQADRISRYVGIDDRPPQLNRLGTQDWNQAKQSTQQAVEEVARELLELYASRSQVEGHAFSADNLWQHELEASFPYVETDDQLQALREVKNDMESTKPMDRLICGDVGYGKTEVALRAAFKAVMDGKQVAILVPTTVLAQQHYSTFARRLLPFPVKVEMLSRFRTPTQQREILHALSAGQVDIIIGTHRLLQSDVQFKDLGLLIVDEEQRFGVTHKEQLKSMRTEVDVLTLTATPIPRTLYMSLAGVRDISMIQTPPEERLPVVTHVGPTNTKLIRQAILREIERGGQVFFVHNRVQTIETLATRLRKLVPEAEFAVGHGQMDDQRLEIIMTAFAHGDFDVLISTTIIESGLDIPNANTLIVDRADMFGLAQLYQIRGRVGRGANQAYAYFFHSHNSRLTTDARARLDTIGEETNLGAGMSIAMRDLEIRGAGDMLGTRQSGHISAVGFHLYTQLLAQAVKHLKGEITAPHLPAAATTLTIDLPIPAYIPTTFISETALRIQLYRRIAELISLDELGEMRNELSDRFGSLPRAVEGLLYQIHVKLLAQGANATSVSTENGQINIRLPYLASADRVDIQHKLGSDVKVSRTGIWVPYKNEEESHWKPLLLEVLGKLSLSMIQNLGR